MSLSPLTLVTKHPLRTLHLSLTRLKGRAAKVEDTVGTSVSPNWIVPAALGGSRRFPTPVSARPLALPRFHATRTTPPAPTLHVDNTLRCIVSPRVSRLSGPGRCAGSRAVGPYGSPVGRARVELSRKVAAMSPVSGLPARVGVCPMGSGPYTAPGSRRTDAGAAFALPRSRRHRTSPMRVFSTMPWAPWPVFAFPFPARAPHPVPVATTNFAVDEFSEVHMAPTRI
jgi:hypothetical protein